MPVFTSIVGGLGLRAFASRYAWAAILVAAIAAAVLFSFLSMQRAAERAAEQRFAALMAAQMQAQADAELALRARAVSIGETTVALEQAARRVVQTAVTRLTPAAPQAPYPSAALYPEDPYDPPSETDPVRVWADALDSLLYDASAAAFGAGDPAAR